MRRGQRGTSSSQRGTGSPSRRTRAARRAASTDRLSSPEGEAAARHAGLRYVSDADPGIRRRRRGRAFGYVAPDGTPIRDETTLRRIRALAVPPAWTDVWIAPREDAHLQATGRDVRGRKQYRYHPRFRATREEAKFERLLAFARRLPRIRSRVERDLARPGLPREKVLALVVRLLDVTLARIGNEEYARLNGSFGLTTLRDRHARVGRSSVRFRFRGKSGRVHEVGIRDRRLARLVARCQDLPGQVLFQYLHDDGEPRSVASEDVNAYLRAVSGLDDVGAKDFRTWAGTVLAYRALCAQEGADVAGDARRRVASAVDEVATRLGNTAAVCRRSYIHPAVVDAYLDGSIGRAIPDAVEEQDARPPVPTAAEEASVLRLLERRLRRRKTMTTSPAAA